MSLKLKLKPQAAQDGDAPQTAPSAAAAPSPSPGTAGGGAPKLKLSFSQPPTPATEQPPSAGPGPAAKAAQKKKAAPKKPTDGANNKGGGSRKKRAANDDISPAAKKVARQPARKPSLMIKMPTASKSGRDTGTTPGTAGTPRIKINPLRKKSQIKKFSISTANVKRPVPPRPTGVGYDSEDSEREEDPAIQQGLILRMQPGEDADRLRNAIANGKIGVKEEGAVDVSLKFLTNDQRRALVRVQDRKYAAALVDLPCIVESMKSWDKKGWWKVADIHQMLLVLGRVHSEDEVKNYPLPREVDKSTMQYAHGLTPPMHYVRKRRFRKRVSYKQMESVEDEVDRLLKEDDEWEKNNPGASITVQEYSHAEWDRVQNESEDDQQHYDTDADGDVVDTTEYYEPADEDIDTTGLEEEMALALADSAFDEPAVGAADLVTESPVSMGDQGASFGAVEHSMAEDSAGETPAATPGADAQGTQDEASSDEDESDFDEDEDDVDVVDEDAAARAAEKAQQLEEVADLEREIAAARAKTNSMTNQLLRKRELEKLGKLEDDLRMKRAAFGLDTED